MDFWLIGSVNQYTKGLARQTQWKLKKQSGDFTSHKKSLQDYVTFTKASDLLPDSEENDTKLSAIVTKAQAGKKLSQDEWEYIKAKNPMLYEKLREIEREQENYEEALKRCKTKDEAQRLHMFKLGEIMAAAKNEDSSALYRLNRMTRTMTEFTASEEYHELPTEGEQAVERENERKAKQEALREEAAVRKEEQKAASQSEETDAEEEASSETDADAKVEFASASEDTAKSFSRTEAGFGDSSHTASADIQRTVPRAAKQTTPYQTELPDRSAPANDDPAPAMSFGHRAYLNQQSKESHAHPHRRVFDTEA